MCIRDRTSSGNNVAGETYSLTCTAVIIGSSDTPVISWKSTVSNETESYGNGTYYKVLHFDPLQVSHDDIYVCQVEVADITDEQQFNLTVQSEFSIHKPML